MSASSDTNGCQEKNKLENRQVIEYFLIVIRKVYSIDEIKSLVTPIAESYGVEALYLFGSYAKGSATSKSDLDIRVDRGEVKSLLQLSGLRIALAEALKKPLDIMTTQSLSDSFLRTIRNDEVVLYARR